MQAQSAVASNPTLAINGIYSFFKRRGQTTNSRRVGNICDNYEFFNSLRETAGGQDAQTRAFARAALSVRREIPEFRGSCCFSYVRGWVDKFQGQNMCSDCDIFRIFGQTYSIFFANNE